MGEKEKASSREASRSNKIAERPPDKKLRKSAVNTVSFLFKSAFNLANMAVGLLKLPFQLLKAFSKPKIQKATSQGPQKSVDKPKTADKKINPSQRQTNALGKDLTLKSRSSKESRDMLNSRRENFKKEGFKTGDFFPPAKPHLNNNKDTRAQIKRRSQG